MATRTLEPPLKETTEKDSLSAYGTASLPFKQHPSSPIGLLAIT